MSNRTYDPFRHCDTEMTPFTSAEEVWFWFMAANQARLDGAGKRDTAGGPARPCEPVDVLRVMDRLYRHRRLDLEHFRILRFYGDKKMRPDPWRPREARASVLWKQAMAELHTAFLEKGIISIPETKPAPSNDRDNNLVWIHQAANNLSRKWGIHDSLGR